MANGAKSSERDFSTVEEEIARLREDVASLTATLKDITAREAHGVADAVRNGLGDAAERVRGASKRLRHGAEDVADSLKSSVEEHPIPSVLLALGLGVIVGILVRR